ncbi:unnamed protein product, partial [marine sediment metagenome]
MYRLHDLMANHMHNASNSSYPDNSNGFDLLLDWEMEIFDEALLGIPADWSRARVAYYLM